MQQRTTRGRIALTRPRIPLLAGAPCAPNSCTTFIVGIALLCTTLCGHAAASDREWVDYRRLLEITQLDKFHGTPAARRDRVRVFGTIEPSNTSIAPADLAFTVVHGNERKRIPVDREGRFDVLVDPAWVKDNPKVLTNMPAGEKARFGFGVMPLAPAGTRFGYAVLMASVQQSNALIREHAGMMRFLMPTFIGIEIHYARGQGATARIGSSRGESIVTADPDGIVRLRLDERLINANAQVILSHAPQAYDFIVD